MNEATRTFAIHHVRHVQCMRLVSVCAASAFLSTHLDGSGGGGGGGGCFPAYVHTLFWSDAIYPMLHAFSGRH